MNLKKKVLFFHRRLRRPNPRRRWTLPAAATFQGWRLRFARVSRWNRTSGRDEFEKKKKKTFRRRMGNFFENCFFFCCSFFWFFFVDVKNVNLNFYIHVLVTSLFSSHIFFLNLIVWMYVISIHIFIFYFNIFKSLVFDSKNQIDV